MKLFHLVEYMPVSLRNAPNIHALQSCLPCIWSLRRGFDDFGSLGSQIASNLIPIEQEKSVVPLLLHGLQLLAIERYVYEHSLLVQQVRCVRSLINHSVHRLCSLALLHTDSLQCSLLCWFTGLKLPIMLSYCTLLGILTDTCLWLD